MKNNNGNDQEKVNLVGQIKGSFSGRKFRNGAYVTMVSAVVIVMVLVVNMLVSKMNIEVDLSSQNMYTLTKETKQLVSGIKDDITIYYMVQSGSEQEMFKKVIEKYDSLSDKIKVEYKDPVLYPTFASTYTDENVNENSLIVVDNTNGKSKYVDYNDMIVQEMDYQTYQTNTTGIDVEGEVTSALQYVTSESTGKIYEVEGHGETAAGTTFKELITKMNLTLESIKTVTVESIPEDCDILYINSPTTDFKPEEAQMIKDYLSAGGNVMATVNYQTTGLTNYLSVLDYYGIEEIDGMVVEGNKNMFSSNNPTYLLPEVKSHDITTKASTSDIPVFMPQCSGVVTSDTTRSSLTIEPLLTTSESSYSKTNLQASTMEKEDGDVNGPFNVGILATDTYNNVTSHLVVYSSLYTFDDSVLTWGNSALLTGTVGYFVGDTGAISIPTKSLEEASVHPNSQDVFLWAAVIIVLVPVAVLAAGIWVSLRRRKK